MTEQGWSIHSTYVDDGYSGTSFDRPAVKNLLEDAENGIINLIIVKDLSRFGRNYIQVGQYIDYIFPLHNVRFIALSDNVDTIDTSSTAMDMMPIMNVFNEWHASSTSKKIKAVIEANAKAGKYRSTFAPYGYDKGSDEKSLPIVDPYAAEVVKRIFTLRSQGVTPRHIADVLNNENIPIPSDYLYAKLGKPNPRRTRHLWSGDGIRQMLSNPTYLGHLVQLRSTTVSYKNHKIIKKAEEDMIIVKNTHEPIISQELWDKCREVEASVSQGKKTKTGEVKPLSGLMYCIDCGEKMRLAWNNTTNGSKKKPRIYVRHNYNCGTYNRFGKKACTSHYIKMKDIDALILADIRSMAKLVIDDEKQACADFLQKKQQFTEKQTADDLKKLNDGKFRLTELEKLMQSIYEDKVLGKIPEDVCVKLLEKYQSEQNSLSAEVLALESKLSAVKQDENDVDEFIKRLKKYTDVSELSREMCLELIEYITVDEYSADRARDIHIYYKLLDKELADKRFLEVDKSTGIA